MPHIQPDPSLCSPDSETLGEILPPADFHDLYRLAQNDGLPYFARIDAVGDVELYLVFESVEAFSESARGDVSVEWKTYRDKLLAVIWTSSDPVEPLGFPLSFDVREERDRYMVLRLVQQPSTFLHHLALEAGQLIHIYTETFSFSAAERERVAQKVRQLLTGDGGEESSDSSADEVEEVKEAEMISVAADTLSDQTLQENGVAYLFDYAAMCRQHGDDQAQLLLMDTLNKALLVMRRHARSEVRERSFTVWVGEMPPYLSLVVTPELYDLFEVVHTSEEEANPFTRLLLALPQFVETRELKPLAIGAYPIIRAERGRPFHLELTEAFQNRLRRLFAQNWPETANPYGGDDGTDHGG